jgi:ferredoxin
VAAYRACAGPIAYRPQLVPAQGHRPIPPRKERRRLRGFAASLASCAKPCPALAINIESCEASDGVRRTSRYEIELFKCIWCGYCEKACPTDAIVLTRQQEYCLETRAGSILTKEMLLAIGDRYEREIVEDRRLDAP